MTVWISSLERLGRKLRRFAASPLRRFARLRERVVGALDGLTAVDVPL